VRLRTRDDGIAQTGRRGVGRKVKKEGVTTACLPSRLRFAETKERKSGARSMARR